MTDAASTRYDLALLPAALPDVDFGLRGEHGVPGFGEMWVEHVGGQELASRGVDQGRWQNEEDRRRGVLEAASRSVLRTIEGRDRCWPPRPPASAGDLKEVKLAVLTLVDYMARSKLTCVPHHLFKALARVLDIDAKLDRRVKASVALASLERAAGAGVKKTRAVSIAISTVQRLRLRVTTHQPDKPAISTRQVFGLERLPRRSDGWFEAGVQDRVAAKIVDHIQSKGAASELRWDIFELLEGHFRRHLPPSQAAVVALAYALGRVSDDGEAHPVPLAGVVLRHEFMLRADVDAKMPTSTGSRRTLDMNIARRVRKSSISTRHFGRRFDDALATVEAWTGHPMFPVAVSACKTLRGRLS